MPIEHIPQGVTELMIWLCTFQSVKVEAKFISLKTGPGIFFLHMIRKGSLGRDHLTSRVGGLKKYFGPDICKKDLASKEWEKHILTLYTRKKNGCPHRE